MLSVIVRRLLATIPLLFAVSVMVFLLMYISPGDFLDKLRAAPDVSEEFVAQYERQYGLVDSEGNENPWFIQYAYWLHSLSPVDIVGEDGSFFSDFAFKWPSLGYSHAYNIEVTSLIGQRVLATIILSFCSIMVAWMIAIPLGVLSAIQKDRLFDKLASLGAYAFLSIPEFFSALIAVIIAAQTGLFPLGGASSIASDFLPFFPWLLDRIHHLILPTLVLAVVGVAGMMRVMRANFLDYMRADFTTTARAKGLSERRVMFKHVLRNAINPLITSFGFAFSSLLSGALLVENVLDYPGLGQLMYTALVDEDTYVVMAGIMISVLMLVLGNLLADLLLAWSDPRIRLEQSGAPLSARRILILAAIIAGLPALLIAYELLFSEAVIEATLTALEYAGLGLIALLALACVCLVGYMAFYLGRTLGKPLLRRPAGFITVGVLGLMYLCALLAPFLAPYTPSEQNLEKTFHPPTAFTWSQEGLAVKTYQRANIADPFYEAVEGETVPVAFFTRGAPYEILSLGEWTWTGTLRLIGLDTDAPGERLYLLGSDATGRDVFSRLLYGARVSLSVGLIGISVTLVMGFLIGGMAGYFGGTTDFVAMRFVEFLMAVPGLYLLLSLRSAFGTELSSQQTYLMIILILSVVGWAGTARIIRGMTLSIRGRQFVTAAESLGSPALRNLGRHVLPNLSSYLLVAATLSIPGYILGEAALSFLGLGIQEPDASWGLMLKQAQDDKKVFFLGYWWLLTPGLAIFITVICFNVLGDVLRDIVDPRMKT